MGGVCALAGLVSFAALACETRAALDELALIRSGEPIHGIVTDSREHKSEGGEDLDSWWIDYAYRVGGESHSGRYTDYTDWRVPEPYARTGAPVEIEYVPDKPSVSSHRPSSSPPTHRSPSVPDVMNQYTAIDRHRGVVCYRDGSRLGPGQGRGTRAGSNEQPEGDGCLRVVLPPRSAPDHHCCSPSARASHWQTQV